MPTALVVFAVLFGLAACSDDDSSADAEATLTAYADGVNDRSVDEAMAVFAETSSMIDHPLHPGELSGKDEIRMAVAETVTFARVDPEPYSVSDVDADGDTVSFSYVWINDVGEEYCGFENEIEVDSEGLIVEFRYGDTGGLCE